MVIPRQEIYILTTVDQPLHFSNANRDYYIRVMLVYELLRVAAVVTCLYFPAFT